MAKSSRRAMSVNMHPLNSSPSKQIYSFSKAKRFDKIVPLCMSKSLAFPCANPRLHLHRRSAALLFAAARRRGLVGISWIDSDSLGYFGSQQEVIFL